MAMVNMAQIEPFVDMKSAQSTRGIETEGGGGRMLVFRWVVVTKQGQRCQVKDPLCL